MRKAKPKKRIVLPDPVFSDVKVSKFVNHLMYDGKKNTSYKIFYTALDLVKKKLPNEEKSALEIWRKALENITPQVEVKSRRVGGATFQVPTEIRPDRKESISMKNLISFARKRGGKTMADKLASEIVDAYNEQGGLKDWGVLRRDFSAKPAFAAFATLTDQLGDAQYLGQLDCGSGIRNGADMSVCRFPRNSSGGKQSPEKRAAFPRKFPGWKDRSPEEAVKHGTNIPPRIRTQTP